MINIFKLPNAFINMHHKERETHGFTVCCVGVGHVNPTFYIGKVKVVRNVSPSQISVNTSGSHTLNNTVNH